MEAERRAGRAFTFSIGSPHTTSLMIWKDSDSTPNHQTTTPHINLCSWTLTLNFTAESRTFDEIANLFLQQSTGGLKYHPCRSVILDVHYTTRSHGIFSE